MNKVEEISIQVSNLEKLIQIRINPKRNRILVNGNSCDILPSMIERLYSIIRLWKEKYSGSMLENNEVFHISIIEREKTYSIEGAGAYPENYSEFKDWLGEVCARDIL